MALRLCRECEADVSTEAKECPHCGCPDPTRVNEKERRAQRLASYDSETRSSGDGALKRAWDSLPRLVQLTGYAVAATGVLVPAMLLAPADTTSSSGGGVAAPKATQTSTRQTSEAGEVSDGRSFGEVIAYEMAGSSSPDLARRFDGLIDGIATDCSQSRRWVSDRILSGHQTLIDRGGTASLLDVAAGWREAVRGGMGNCTGMLSALLVMLEAGG